MANFTPPPPRSAANQTPRLIFSKSNESPSFPGETERRAWFADASKAAAFTAGQRYVFSGGSNAVRAFRAETQADFRYTSIQGAVPKW
jgi:hypothetical protein